MQGDILHPTVVVAETRAASARGEGEGEAAPRGSGDCLWLLGVLPGLNLLPLPFDEISGAESKPSGLPLVGDLFALPFLFSDKLARSDSSESEALLAPPLLLLRDILLVDSDIIVDLAAATGLAGRPAIPLKVSTPARTRLAGEGPPLAASNSAAATGLGGRFGLEPLCWRL